MIVNMYYIYILYICRGINTYMQAYMYMLTATYTDTNLYSVARVLYKYSLAYVGLHIRMLTYTQHTNLCSAMNETTVSVK